MSARIVEYECPNCGARLEKAGGGEELVCRYCGKWAKLVERKPRPPQRASPRPAIPSQGAPFPFTPPRPSRIGRLIPLIALLIFAFGGAVFFVIFTQQRTGGGADQAGPHTATPAPTSDGREQRIGWDSVGGPFVTATVDGKDAWIARFRELGVDQLTVGAVDATDGSFLWRFGADGTLGTYGDGYRVVRFAVTGDAVVVSDPRARLHILDRDTGAVRGTVPLTDRVKVMCPYAGEEAVFVATVDGKTVRLDTATGELSLSEEAPEACGPGGARARVRRRLAAANPRQPAGAAHERRAGGQPRERPPSVEGFETTQVLTGEDHMVLEGHRSPGTKVPMAVGVDQKTGEPRWKTVVVSGDPLSVRENAARFGAVASGRYFTVYGMGSDAWHLAAFDAETGDRIWDRKVRPIFAVDMVETLSATDRHVYLGRMQTVEVFDAKTGAPVSTFGTDTFED